MKKLLIWCIPLVLITVALVTPVVAHVPIFKSIQIWPDELRPTNPYLDYHQEPACVCYSGYFYAFFTLPVGTEIWGVTYYHVGLSSPTYTTFEVRRIKMYGGWSGEPIASCSSTDSSGGTIPVSCDINELGDPIIREGYRYYIMVGTSDGSCFGGAKIRYMIRRND